MQEKKIPGYATHGALNNSTLRTRPHTPDTFNPQIKRNKEVATSLEVRWFPLAPAARVSSAPTDSLAARPRRRWFDLRPSLAREPKRVCAHVGLARPKGSRSSEGKSESSLSHQKNSKARSKKLESSKQKASTPKTTLSLSHQKAVSACPHALFVLALRPLFGRASALSANRGRTRLLLSSPRQVAFHTRRKIPGR